MKMSLKMQDTGICWLWLALLFSAGFVKSQSLVGTVQCHNRREISPCTCRYNEPTVRHRAIEVKCYGVNSFATVMSALTAQFDISTEISLQISQSQLDDLATLSFSRLNLSIYKLSLNLDNLREFPEAVFTGLSQVEYLSLADNNLEAVPSHILPLMPSIKILDLKGGNISFVSKDDFQNLPNLTSIILRENNISVVEQGSLPNTITRLQLGRNNLTTLNDTLRGMSDLQWLWLNGNQLKSLEGQFPTGKVLRLHHLSVENNLLETAPSDLRRCGALNALRLDSNRITSLNGALTLARNLEHLNLTENNLTSLASDDFTELIHLQELEISWNQLVSLNGSLLPLKSLQLLVLSHNMLAEFDLKDILGLNQLHTVDISHNRIKTLVSRTENMVGLEVGMLELRLDHNQLESLGGALMNLHRLKSLNLTHNLLTAISPDDFIGLDSLEILDISHNRLTTLEETSKTVLPSLDSLFASYNDVHFLDKDFHGLPRLCWADLTHNRIETISTHLVERTRCQLYGVPTTLRIYLQGNPALCQSVELDKLVQMEVSNSTKFHGGPQDCQNALEPDLNQHPFFRRT